MRLSTFINITLLMLAGCSRKDRPEAAVPPPAPPAVRVDDIALSYPRLTAVTNEPVLVSAQFAALCAPAYDPEADLKKFGPHAQTAVRIFMNDSAAGAFRAASGNYPVGSVVVKEKQSRAPVAGLSKDPNQSTDAVGGMIKRAPGYDPAHGDWEYFYFTSGGKIESGRIESCVNCHAAAAKKGYVFGDWRQGS